MVKVAVLDDFTDDARRVADYASLPPELEIDFFQRHFNDEEKVAELQQYEIIISQRERNAWPRSVLERMPNLKMLISNGRRNPFLDYDAAADLGIKCVNSGDFPRPDSAAARPARNEGGGFNVAGGSTGELTWGLILAITRQIPRESESVRHGGWQTVSGPQLVGKTLGIVGLGNIGAGVGRVGKAFGMNVIAWSQNLTADRAAEAGFTYTSKEELFRSADIVTLHYALSERSVGIVGAAELALMKPTAYIINTARGPLIDEAALVAALREKRIAGAAMDVFNEEPLPLDHPYRSLDNVIATPHIGYGSTEGYAGFHRSVVRTLQDYTDGKPLNEY